MHDFIGQKTVENFGSNVDVFDNGNNLLEEDIDGDQQ